LPNIFFPILLVLAVSGCTGDTNSAKSADPAVKLELDSKPEFRQGAAKMITLRGTIRYKNLEGGFWGLEGNDGNKYMPSGLNKALLVDGMVVEVVGIIEEDEGLMTIQQYGRIFKVKNSKMIDNSKARSLNSY
jgi:hypothetical protein